MLEDISVRPYFFRAVYQWCVDKGYTPHLLVNWREDNPSPVPKRLINNGKIVFNISPDAVRHLAIDADSVFFTARFLGKTTEVRIPVEDIASVYAREKQSGISFPPAPRQPQPPAAAPARKPGRKKITAADIKIV